MTLLAQRYDKTHWKHNQTKNVSCLPAMSSQSTNMLQLLEAALLAL